MSNIGKIAINLPPHLSIQLKTYADFQRLIFSGPHGHSKAINLPSSFRLSFTDNTLSIVSPDKVLWGTVRQHIQRLVTGLSTGFQLNLQITGIGYKVSQVQDTLKLALGFSHEIEVKIPEGIEATCPNSTSILLKSNSYLPLTAFAHSLVSLRSSLKDRYKKKGILVL